MQYLDQNEYVRRIGLVNSLISTRPYLMSRLSPDDRQLLASYFLADRDITAFNLSEHRSSQLKRNSTIELEAHKAYERLMSDAGLPESLTSR